MGDVSHAGHRERMRKRLRAADSLDGFSEHEILEMLLFFIYPRGNTNDVAHRLIDRYGSIKGLKNAPVGELSEVGGIGVGCSESLRFLGMVYDHVADYEDEKLYLDDFRFAHDYIYKLLSSERKEKLLVFCLDKTGRLVKTVSCTSKSSGEINVDMIQLVKTMLASGCEAVLIAHNHPNTISQPSSGDITFTRRLLGILSQFRIPMYDHCIVGVDGVLSMRKNGIIHENE